MQLSDLLPELRSQRGQNQNVFGITADSRQVKPNMIFVAISGFKQDGHDYIEAAIKAGAIAIIAEKNIPALNFAHDVPILKAHNSRLVLSQLSAKLYPHQPSVIAAITGTNGKTSVAEFLRQIWQLNAWRSASLGTLGIRGEGFSPPSTTGQLTTLDPVALHQNLNALARGGFSHVAIEASSHGIEQERLSSVKFSAAGFTNLSRDHLDYHTDMEAYFQAKALLFTQLLPDAATAVINRDDEYAEQLIKMLEKRDISILSVGRNAQAFLRLEKIDYFDHSMTLTIIAQGEKYTIPLALIGEFQAHNALMAAGLAFASGLCLYQALLALPYLRATPGRMQAIHHHKTGSMVVIDYAHTPAALKNALASLRAETKGKLGVVFGCGGDRDEGKRPQMGSIAKDYADFTIITNDNPRNENPLHIRQAIHDACPNAEDIGDRHMAIKHGISRLNHGDILLVAGKGHENNQLIGSETLPFSDEATVNAIIKELSA